MQALRALWSDAGPLIFVSGPIKLDNADATIAQVYRASESQPVTAPAENAVQTFAYTDFGVRSPILERQQSKVLDVTQIRFGNNVRLNLKPTKFEANSVSIAVRFGGGRLQLPLDKPGLKQLAESTFLSGGLEKHSLDDLNRIIAGRTVGLGFDVEDDAFVLGGHTTPGDLLLQLQLLAAYVVAPGYRPEALDKFRQGLPQLYKSLDRTPGGILQRDVTRFLRSGDPRFGYPAQAVLASRTLEELRGSVATAAGQRLPGNLSGRRLRRRQLHCRPSKQRLAACRHAKRPSQPSNRSAPFISPRAANSLSSPLRPRIRKA